MYFGMMIFRDLRLILPKNNKRVNLGYYKTFEEAKAVRLKAQDEYFGEYSYEHSQSI